MFRWRYIVLVSGLIILAFATSLIATDRAQNFLKSMYLGSAKIVNKVSWREVRAARSIIAADDATAKIAQIGKMIEGGRPTIVVFSGPWVYMLEADRAGKWKLKSKTSFAL